MIQLTLRLVAGADGEAGMVQTLRSLMFPIRAAAGFRSAELYREVDRPNVLYYVEEWDNQEGLDQQIRSTHFTQLLALMETAAEPPEFRLCWIADEKGLHYLEQIRLGVPLIE